MALLVKAILGDDKPMGGCLLTGKAFSYIRKIESDKWLAWGRGQGGRFLQVIFVVDPEETVYVIHARPLNEQEKRRLRRRQR